MISSLHKINSLKEMAIARSSSPRFSGLSLDGYLEFVSEEKYYNYVTSNYTIGNKTPIICGVIDNNDLVYYVHPYEKWITDYVIAETDVDNKCNLLHERFVRFINSITSDNFYVLLENGLFVSKTLMFSREFCCAITQYYNDLKFVLNEIKTFNKLNGDITPRSFKMASPAKFRNGELQPYRTGDYGGVEFRQISNLDLCSYGINELVKRTTMSVSVSKKQDYVYVGLKFLAFSVATQDENVCDKLKSLPENNFGNGISFNSKLGYQASVVKHPHNMEEEVFNLSVVHYFGNNYEVNVEFRTHIRLYE